VGHRRFFFALLAALLFASRANADFTVTATWHDNSTGEDGFQLSRKCDDETVWTVVQTTAANATTVQDTVSASLHTCSYVVNAFKSGAADSPDSNIRTLYLSSPVDVNMRKGSSQFGTRSGSRQIRK